MKSTWKRKGYRSKFKQKKKKIGETHGREQSKEKRENKLSIKRMTHGWDDAHQHSSQCGITHHSARALCTEENDV